MLRIGIAVSVLSLVFVVCPAPAQTNDICILAGAYAPSLSVSNQPAPVSVSAGASVQIGYAHQLRLMRSASLDLDVPLTIATHHGEVIGWDMSVSSQTNLFFTPGIRYRLNPQTGISPFVVLGGGVGSFGTAQGHAGSSFSLRVERVVSPVLGFGGGADFRITQLLSFRGEVRDFVGRAGLGGTEGRHHPVFVVGFGFHFN